MAQKAFLVGLTAVPFEAVAYPDRGVQMIVKGEITPKGVLLKQQGPENGEGVRFKILKNACGHGLSDGGIINKGDIYGAF